MKDCAFQYATDDGTILEDTDLISRDDAEELWQKYIPTFKKHLEEGRGPEMAIWIDMATPTSYKETSAHWCAEDFIIRDGKMFSVVSVA